MATMELHMVKNEYNIPTEQLEYYKKEIMELLPKYRYKANKHYDPTNQGVDAMLKVYNQNKGWMYPYFMSHPNYIGNGKIAFSSDYHRKVNTRRCQSFLSWLYDQIIDIYMKRYSARVCGMTFNEVDEAICTLDYILDHMYNIISTSNTSKISFTCKVNNMSYCELANERERLYEILDRIKTTGTKVRYKTYINKDKAKEMKDILSFINEVSSNPHMFTTKDEIEYLNQLTESLDLRIVAGQKFSRIINKLCTKVGIDKVEGYQQKFAKFGDDINELSIKRHTIISINPIDYLTMSFGNSWASCHTIDKLNDRYCPNSYSGQWSGGTLSYMLDGSTVVFYTVDKAYDGTDFELQNKVNRCMFNLGEDKLIQGRVYPQSNDGDQTIYNEVRAIMQKTVSEMFNVNNLWILKQGTSACSEVTYSQGAHYRDYLHYGNCNVSYLKPDSGYEKNPKRIVIGHKGICPTCGEEHSSENYIICSNCVNNVKRCPHCGKVIRNDDHIEIDGQVYCSNCAKYCAHHQRWEIDTPMTRICTNPRFVKWNRRSSGTSCEYSNNYVCEQAISENPTRYRKDANTGRYFDTTVDTNGIEVRFPAIDGERVVYYASKENAEYDGYKEAYNGKWYHKSNLYFDRHAGVKAYIPYTEWNDEYSCWNGIVDQVREQHEKMVQRAARRAAREARRSTENAA